VASKNRVIGWGLLLLKVTKEGSFKLRNHWQLFSARQEQNQPQLLSLRAAANQHSNDFVGL
jgi:hypothetical protein